MARGYLELHDPKDDPKDELGNDSLNQSTTSSDATLNMVSSSPGREEGRRRIGGTLVNGSKKQTFGDQQGVELDDLLRTNPDTGLSHEEAVRRLSIFGKNEMIEVKPSQLKKFLGYFLGPIAYLIIVACIISAIVKVKKKKKMEISG